MGTGSLLWLFATAALAGLALLVWSIRGDRSRNRPRCPRCWYSMADAASLRCPECGHEARNSAALLRTRRRPRWAAAGMLVLIASVAGPAILAIGWPQLVPAGVWRAVMPLIDPRAKAEIASLGLATAMSNDPPLERLRTAYRASLVLDGEADSAAVVLSQWAPTPRSAALNHLWDAGDERRIARPSVERIFHDRTATSHERTLALWLLSSMGEGEAVPYAVAALTTDEPDTEVRQAAMQQLKSCSPRDPEMIPTFIQILDDPEPKVRREAAQALGWYKDAATAALDKLHQLAKEDPDEVVRRAAEGAAARISGKQ